MFNHWMSFLCRVDWLCWPLAIQACILRILTLVYGPLKQKNENGENVWPWLVKAKLFSILRRQSTSPVTRETILCSSPWWKLRTRHPNTCGLTWRPPCSSAWRWVHLFTWATAGWHVSEICGSLVRATDWLRGPRCESDLRIFPNPAPHLSN